MAKKQQKPQPPQQQHQKQQHNSKRNTKPASDDEDDVKLVKRANNVTNASKNKKDDKLVQLSPIKPAQQKAAQLQQQKNAQVSQAKQNKLNNETAQKQAPISASVIKSGKKVQKSASVSIPVAEPITKNDKKVQKQIPVPTPPPKDAPTPAAPTTKNDKKAQKKVQLPTPVVPTPVPAPTKNNKQVQKSPSTPAPVTQKGKKQTPSPPPPPIESEEEVQDDEDMEDEDQELDCPEILYTFIAHKYPDLIDEDGGMDDHTFQNLLQLEIGEGDFMQNLMEMNGGELSSEDIDQLQSFFESIDGEGESEGEGIQRDYDFEEDFNEDDFMEIHDEDDDLSPEEYQRLLEKYADYLGEGELSEEDIRKLSLLGEGETEIDWTQFGEQEGEYGFEEGELPFYFDQIGENEGEFDFAGFEGEYHIDDDELLRILNDSAEGEMAPGEGEMDLDGEGELSPEEYAEMMAMMGEGEFDFGEGEEGDIIDAAEYETLGEIGSSDEEEDRSENDDLDELLSLEAPAKKKAKKGSQKMDDSDDEDEDFDEIQAEFNFHDPDNDKDWHATKKFIASLIDKKDFDASEFADIITKQAIVGTTIKCPDAGEEPLGFISVIDLKDHQKATSIKQIKDYVVNNAGSDKNKKVLQKLFSDNNVGLLLTDRLVNLPMDVVPPLYNELIKDLEFAAKQEKGKWKFSHYVLISPCCEAGGMSVNKKKGAAAKNDDSNQAQTSEVWYTRFEDEFFAKHAVISRKVQTSLMKPWMETGKLPVQNMIMIMKQDALYKVRDHLAKVIGLGGEEANF